MIKPLCLIFRKVVCKVYNFKYWEIMEILFLTQLHRTFVNLLDKITFKSMKNTKKNCLLNECVCFNFQFQKKKRILQIMCINQILQQQQQIIIFSIF